MYKINIPDILRVCPVTAAPMAGVTDLPYRKIIRRYHQGLSAAEMISSQSLVRCKSKTLYKNQIVIQENPTSYQLLGRRPDYMAQAAMILEELGAEIIDINMGCSVRKVIKQSEGGALIAEPNLALEIAEAVAKAVKVPVILKIRKSFRSISSEEIIKNAENAGIKAVAVHGRSSEQLYSGSADWDYITKVRGLTNLPLIANGDIKTPQDAKFKLDRYGADAVMIGRGVLGNPWILKNSFELIKNGTVKPITNSEKIETGTSHILLSEEIDGEANCFKRIRKHLAWYIKGMPMASAFRDAIFHTRTLEHLKQMWSSYGAFIAETELLEPLPLGALEPLYHKFISK